ncbi:MAG: transglycosylase domain-containing protein [Hyphomicrobiales bacterium]
MGIFTTRKKPKRKQRIEPQLFAGRVSEPSGKRRRRSLAGVLFSFFLLVGLWGAIGAGLGFGYVWLTLDGKGVLQIPAREPGIMLLAADGGVLAEQGAFYGDEVRLGDLPDYVPNAVIAIEDRRFRAHWGIDPQGLIRAAYENYRAGRVVQGGSTITQQLAKNLFLEPDRTYWRKLQEMVLAIWLEARFSKDEILQLYLNRVYFGGGATGIEKAAQAYYRKPARDLSLAEAATLAGLLKAPATYNPATHPEAAAERAKLVLAGMTEEGAISPTEAARAIDNPAEVVASNYVPATQYVADWVIEQLPEFVRDYDQSIVVETTIDPSLQFAAEKSLRRHLAEEGAKLDVGQAAFVMLDTSGAIKAMVGGRSYKKSQFNRAAKAKRQPGSAFKPFVYLAAIEQGLTPDSVEIDEPVRIGDWQPENYKRKYLGPVTLEKAFALSLNTISAKLTSYVGPDSVAAVAHRLGIASALGRDASIALGTSEVTLLELTAAFTPFANGGAPVQPFAVRRILNRDGVVLYERNGDGLGQAISIYDLGSMNRMLRAVVTEGTGRRAQFGGFDLAGKTGTSQDYRNAWFIGYSSYLVAGVWAGNDDNSPTRKVTGGSLPAAIWKDVMEQAHLGLMPQPLPGEDATGDLDGIAMLPGEQDLAGLADSEPRSGGFLDTIGGFFGGDTEPPPKYQKRRKKWWEGNPDR